ncbi:DUF2975 domain-containing protein [Stieleria sp. JC731]|uniref:DUF2975 domain-containing protein n=1 Tax=Pirellulaceae TaxID=2691357 RepID=UPI001E5BA5A9|nr:DUF2975 domain-containing protein [Stieleria sp. JC731]MCC9600274.1 DUF2975 domain-containing protein [Stieleria sp. JC731]
MNTKPISLSLLKLFVNVWWWGLIATAAIASLWITLAPSAIDHRSFTGYASHIDTSPLQAIDRSGHEVNVEFDGPAKVKLTYADAIETEPPGFKYKALALVFLGAAFSVSLCFVKQLRDIVRTIDQDDPFVPENASRLRTIGMLIMLFAFAKGLGQFLISGYADTMVTPTGFNLNGRLEFPAGLFTVAIVVLVLSEVFRHGTRIREEQSLTI